MTTSRATKGHDKDKKVRKHGQGQNGDGKDDKKGDDKQDKKKATTRTTSTASVDSRDKMATARRTKRPTTSRTKRPMIITTRAARVEDGKKDAYKDKQGASTGKRATNQKTKR